MLYELATLSCPPLEVAALSPCARDWIDDGAAKGQVLGMWRSEIGTIGQLLVLRGFEAESDLRRERRRALLSTNPFNANRVATSLSMEPMLRFHSCRPSARVSMGIFSSSGPTT